MRQIKELDPNFKVPKTVDESGYTYFDCLQPPFSIYGLLTPTQTGNIFLRMPDEASARVSEGVHQLNTHTAGGRLRFITDSPSVAIRARLNMVSPMPHFPLCGSSGFDLYYKDGDWRYGGTFMPPITMKDGYESSLTLPKAAQTIGSSMREILIDFPLYSGVSGLEIGLMNGASLLPAEGYRYSKPAVFYGSSITQGGCASRPGNAYQNILSRRLDLDFINLGFSGNAKGETAIAQYIADLPMSVFVYDYDHNASLEQLKDTHERMFLQIRERQPDLPVIMISRPQPFLNEDECERRRIIETTCQNAVRRGDRHVYFIDGSRLLHRFGGDSGTVDRCHPNDLGFMCMADGIEPVLRQALAESEGRL